MKLKNIYQPIETELKGIDEVLKKSFNKSKNQSILKLGGFLLKSGGKRIRPALVILSAKAALNCRLSRGQTNELIEIASAIELIHIASLIHDDVIDRASLRHNLPTVNFRWGPDVSIALGDYLYSVAFDLISRCGNMDVLQCISSATRTMCEGELLQVCERDNLDLLKERYIIIVKKKTASLFAASCQTGALISNRQEYLRGALKEYGLNFGIAFQIVDDYLDLAGEKEVIGKSPGQDIRAGELTLPLLNLLESLPAGEREELEKLLNSKKNNESVERIRARLFSCGAAYKTRDAASSYIALAKGKVTLLPHSPYKESLLSLADFIIERGFNDRV